MREAAANLEFEKAASIRDQIKRLRAGAWVSTTRRCCRSGLRVHEFRGLRSRRSRQSRPAAGCMMGGLATGRPVPRSPATGLSLKGAGVMSDERNNGAAGVVVAFTLGALVGAVVALLFAPGQGRGNPRDPRRKGPGGRPEDPRVPEAAAGDAVVGRRAGPRGLPGGPGEGAGVNHGTFSGADRRARRVVMAVVQVGVIVSWPPPGEAGRRHVVAGPARDRAPGRAADARWPTTCSRRPAWRPCRWSASTGCSPAQRRGGPRRRCRWSREPWSGPMREGLAVVAAVRGVVGGVTVVPRHATAARAASRFDDEDPLFIG